MTFDDLKKAVQSEWLKLALLFIAAIGGWYKFDFRIAAVERREDERAQQDVKRVEQIEELSQVITKLNATLERMNQTMRDFPPHRHLDDNDVVYPGDVTLPARPPRRK